ncbi:MAG TPA: serine/threonine-protein kinase [Kofleriaceae bacterium]|nr:serine/threonine-protein kinase [Kofleriaceae bacterium]
MGEELGAGGVGTVYRAERMKLGRAVAIKFLQPEFARQPDFIKRFEREALAMSRIYHQHCVSIIDYGLYEDSPYLVMEYVPGRSLSRILREGPLAPRRAVKIMLQVLDTLAYFHRRNVLHRDLKAENIMIAGDEHDDEDFVVLLDFGMAKLLSGVGADISVSVKGVVVGTPSSMSPEQIREQTLDARADLYSCGVLLYHMLVGKRPFQSDDMVAVFKMHLEQPPVPPTEILGTRAISRELEAVVMKALEKDRDARWPDARAMAEALVATREAREQDRRASTVGSMRLPVARSRATYAGWVLAAVFAALFAVSVVRRPSSVVREPEVVVRRPSSVVRPPDPVDAPVVIDAPPPPDAAVVIADAADDPTMRAVKEALSGPDGDQQIDALVKKIDEPILIDALVAATTADGTWYLRHHARFALQRLHHLERADDVAMWIADLAQATTCFEIKRARSELADSRDPRAAAALRDGPRECDQSSPP